MGFLSPYRVLDLTDERGLMAGRIFADLGAEVVHVEPPGGSTARKREPLLPTPTGSRSLLWEAYTFRQRGITCNIACEQGRGLLLELSTKADFVFESFSAGSLAKLGLGYEGFRRANPAIVHVSITAFGDEGPKGCYADADLIVWAAGGPLQPHRDGDLPPLRITVPQAFRNAGADAADGALIAHLHRVRTGVGQHVSVSAQISVAQTTISKILAGAVGDSLHGSWQQPSSESLEETPARVDQSGSGSSSGATRTKWRVRDGFIEMHLAMGPSGGRTNNFWAWLIDNNADGGLPVLDWRKVASQLQNGDLTMADLEPYRDRVRVFLATKTKQEVAEAAIERTFMAAPINDIADIAKSPQHKARDLWLTVGAGTPRELTVPAKWAQASELALATSQEPAPLIGEHNYEVYHQWLGHTENQVRDLAANGVI